MLEPKEGLLTFRAEGNNITGSRYYSRKLHWPGMESDCNSYGSGVTIGRGYDMKHRSTGEIISHLTLAGVPINEAKKIAGGAHKSHCAASDFVKNNRGSTIELTEQQQLRLFEKVYAGHVKDSIRFYNKYKKQDSVSWGELHKVLKEVLIDMRFQGALRHEMISVFGKNKKQDVIKLINGNAFLANYESARGRVRYIQEYMK